MFRETSSEENGWIQKTENGRMCTIVTMGRRRPPRPRCRVKGGGGLFVKESIFYGGKRRADPHRRIDRSFLGSSEKNLFIGVSYGIYV